MQIQQFGILLGALTMLSIAPSAEAAASQDFISDIVVEGTQFARINVTTASGSRPACHNAAFVSHYGFDISTAKGKALLSISTSAMLAGKKVRATGLGSCTNIGSVTIETLDNIVLFR